ncbi:hypothetical protein [Bradyrhizobium sp. USDA 4503]
MLTLNAGREVEDRLRPRPCVEREDGEAEEVLVLDRVQHARDVFDGRHRVPRLRRRDLQLFRNPVALVDKLRRVGHQRGLDVPVERILAQLDLGHLIEGGAQHVEPPLYRCRRVAEFGVKPLREIELTCRCPERDRRHRRLDVLVEVLLGELARSDGV